MKNLVEKIISLFTSHKIFLLLKKYLLCFCENKYFLLGLEKFFKFHIKLLYKVSENVLLYFIYIFLFIYGFLAWESDMAYHISNYIL